jgi:hypothetical protein
MVRAGRGAVSWRGGEAYQGLVWQCHFSGIEVPDHLWKHAPIGLDRPYADDQADDMMSETEALAAFDLRQARDGQGPRARHGGSGAGREIDHQRVSAELCPNVHYACAPGDAFPPD